MFQLIFHAVYHSFDCLTMWNVLICFTFGLTMYHTFRIIMSWRSRRIVALIPHFDTVEKVDNDIVTTNGGVEIGDIVSTNIG